MGRLSKVDIFEEVNFEADDYQYWPLVVKVVTVVIGSLEVIFLPLHLVLLGSKS